MVAIDIFQQCMQSMFHSLLDSIIIYIENNLLFTKGSFEHHLQKLKQVFIILLANSRHVHIEQTFLTSTAVNYLGYTLTSKGRKRIFLLSFGLLHHKIFKQLRCFLGFVNYYKKIWHQRSKICRPFTQSSSSKVSGKGRDS